ncbi:MAG: cytosine/adenosine deaminase-related metal-dependent hydrolase [Alphaproteobacteria bacterium]
MRGPLHDHHIFQNVDWIVAWDADHDTHAYLQGGDLVFEGDTIIFIGSSYVGDSDHVINGADLCLMPGFVDIHAHPASEVFFRGLREDHSVPEHYMTGLYERSCVYAIDQEDKKYGAEVSYADLMLSGVTTLVDITFPYPGWTDIMARSGLRAYAAPGFNTATWMRDNHHQLKYDVDEAKGWRNFENSLVMIDELRAHPSGLLNGIVSPVQIDNNTTDILVASRDAARERGLLWTTHASQSVVEFNIMVDRHGVTPVQHLNNLGLLGEGVILGHAMLIDDNSWIRWHTKTDLKLLGDSHTAVAHCPTPFMRYGTILESFNRFREAGVVLGIGTDTIPHNFIEDLRYAAIMARIASRDGNAGSTADVFYAGTVAGAIALGRNDIGRLKVGAKADIVVLDLDHPLMKPGRDPLAALIHSAAERAVKDVYIDGRQVVKNHEVLTLNRNEAAGRLREGQARMESGARQRDFAGRSHHEITPLTLRSIT